MASYTIRSGDTLSGIAARYGTSVGAIAAANGISNPNLIYAGRTLHIPDGFSRAAPAPVTLAPAPTSGAGDYTVRAGDTLSGIAQRFGSSVGAIAQLNGIHNPNLIFAGQHLRIPGAPGSTPAPAPAPSPGASYTVRSGDTLSGIAQRFGTTVAKLAADNGIANPNLIFVGQRLTVRGGSGGGDVSGPGPIAPPPVVGPTTGGISPGQLKAIMPSLSDSKAAAYLPYLNAAMAEGGINTPRRQAAFLAQLAHESGELKYFEEIASGAAYEGRADLGNVYPGDGVRFKGRGPIQLTGRSNYRAAGQALGLDLVNNTSRAADPDVGFRIAQWFWNSRGLNAAADANNFDYITLRINGGYNGKAARDAYYARARGVLGA